MIGLLGGERMTKGDAEEFTQSLGQTLAGSWRQERLSALGRGGKEGNILSKEALQSTRPSRALALPTNSSFP